MNNLLLIKFFYDNFDQSDVCGMYSFGHFLIIFIFIVTMFLALRYAKNMTDKEFSVVKTVIAISVTVLEILKISIRIYKGEHCDSYMPLYFCSLFIFAIWLTFSNNKVIKNCGYSYITMGGVLASVTYLFYPSTSLPLFPIWHPSTLHSFWYHWTMLFFGLIALKRKEYVPCAKDSVKFFVFIVAACIPSVIINEQFGTNCMFLGNPFNLPILDGILQYSKVLYIACRFRTGGCHLLGVARFI